MLTFGDLLVYIIAYFGLFTAIFFIITLLQNRKRLANPISHQLPKVSIMVPVYNAQHTLAKTVLSLLSLNYPKDKLEIIIINDGSTDKTLAEAKKFIPLGVKVLSIQNRGKGGALNHGLKHCSGEFVGALDADSYVNSDALKKIIGYFNDKKTMAVTPSMKVYEPSNWLQKVQQIEYLMGVFLRKIFAFLGSIHVTPGPFTIYRKAFFDKYGGYDEDNATEDIEIALRIQKNNYRIDNSVDACVYTVSPSKMKPLLKQRIRWYRGFMDNVLNYKSLFSKDHGNLGVFILPASFVSVFLVIVALFYTVIKLSIDNYHGFINFYNTGFDLKYLLPEKIDFFLFNLSSTTILSIMGLFIGVAMILIAKRLSKEGTKIKLSYFYYMFLYMPLFGFWWLCALYYKIFNKKILWGKRWV